MLISIQWIELPFAVFGAFMFLGIFIKLLSDRADAT
jgi:hypothetical protein